MFGVVAGFARRILLPVAVAAVAGTLSLGTTKTAQAAEIYAGIVVDVKTGRTLYADNADSLRYPASLTKMMTLYLLFEDLEAGQTRLTSRITFSANAAAEPPSKLGIRAGGTLTVRDAILALVTRSANDVATAIAEHLEGSESAFATRMTNTARAIGMSRTTFKNAHGLPNSAQVTTARDMATLGRALMDRFPSYFEYFSTPSFRFNGVTIRNHNNLLGRVSGVNGIKTGYTRASGYNLVTSVNRNGRQIVAVVMGGRSGSSRDAHMVDLINRYLPQASNGARTAPLLVASAPSGPTRGNPFAVGLDQVPAPPPRPATGSATPEPVLVAAADPVPAIPTAPAAPMPLVPSAPPSPAALAYVDPLAELLAEGDADVQEVIEFAIAAAPEPAPAPAATPPAAIADASAIPPEVWKIQIGAMPNQGSATATLERARQAAPTVLASVTPYTEPVPRNGETLYRARFAGFIDQNAAQAACAVLVREDFACLAVR
ncbi:MAG: D-alanyl-D-alanine carboxypeptidase [Bauldia sp.]|nr:D-alanyl-D-alanine carboxypeptidase [Bauldia sp.]